MANYKEEESIAKYIEYTLLKPDVLEKDIHKLCEEAMEYEMFGICISPYFIYNAKQILSNSNVKVVSVVGFPMGYSSTSAKVEEVKKAVNDGVDELDMVLNLSALKNNDFKFLRNDIDSVLTATRWSNKLLKIIIETAALSELEIRKVCDLCAELDVDFVKTSTGYHQAGGATEKDVKLLRNILPDKIKIKASGGIKDADFARKLIKAGADRIGTSSGLKIVQG